MAGPLFFALILGVCLLFVSDDGSARREDLLYRLVSLVAIFVLSTLTSRAADRKATFRLYLWIRHAGMHRRVPHH